MKLKYAITILVIGFCIRGFGILQKILHTPIADSFLLVGKCILIVGCVLFVYMLFKKQK